jgi:hypothetical protein
MAKAKTTIGFRDFYNFLNQKEHRYELLVITGLYIAFLFIFFTLYPLPSTLTDSANYVYCAKTMQPGGYRPFGYSWFLNAIHIFSSSIKFVTLTQFFITAFSTTLFIYTLKYFYKPASKLLWYTFILLAVAAPPTLYMAHALLSDSLFCFLTLMWVITAIWVIHTRSIILFLLHLLMLYWALEVRYTGLFYPAFSILITITSFDKIYYRLGLSVLCIFTAVYFYKSTKSEMKKMFGVNTFSGFSGWQLVSNALHVVPHVQVNPAKARDEQTRAFLNFINQTDKSFYNRGVSAHFMWHKESPLKQYTYWRMQTQNMDYLRAWLLSGEDFSKFGSYLIKTYPVAFTRYYLLPNTWNVFYPPARGAIHKIEDIVVDDLFHEWYGLEKGNKFSTGRSELYTQSSTLLAVGNLLLWAAFFAAIIVMALKWKTLQHTPEQVKTILFLILFALGYAAFNAFAGPFEYRYIIPIRLLLIALPFVVLANQFVFRQLPKGS